MLLERLLENMSVAVEPFALCEIETGCRLALEETDEATVHFVLAGSGTLLLGRKRHPFDRGALVVVPKGRVHALTASTTSTAAPRVTVAGLTHHTSLGEHHRPDLVTACARITARFGDAYGLFELLDEPIVLDFASDAEMRGVFADMLEESALSRPGSRAMLAALMNRCLVMMFRRLCEASDCSLPWLDALEDERMVAALDLMLSQPGDDHSIESLARHVAMSRTAFATEFRQSFGAPPMTFLRGIRLRRAAELLTSTTLGVRTIASRVGFSSRAHFSTVFRQEFGVAPGAFRSRSETAA